MNTLIKNIKKLKISFNIKMLIFYFGIAILFYFLSDGDFSGIVADFKFYFNRLIFIRDYSIPINQWFSNNLAYGNELNLDRVSNFVPTPFYSLIFLGPYFLHRSDIFFALQGVFLTYLAFRGIKIYLKKIYFSLNENLINLIMIIGSLNPAFLKDSLTSSPVSICNLFLIYGFLYKDKFLVSSILLACAAMTRSSYIIYWITILISCLTISSSITKKFLKISIFSLIIYIIFYIYFYQTYPGSQFSFVFLSGLKDMEVFDNYFVSALSKYYEITNSIDLMNLDISFFKFLRLIFSDLKIAYGTFVAWIFKILSSLGFIHMNLFWDMRSLYLQRFSTLLYFILIMGPGFIISIISLVSIPKINKRFWFKNEKLILKFGILFLLIHSIVMGLPRYAICSSWIISAFLVRFVIWFKHSSQRISIR